MQNAIQILILFKVYQPEIESVLQAKRPSFLAALQKIQQTVTTLNQKATSLPNDKAEFNNEHHRIEEEIGQELGNIANELLKLFLSDETLYEIIMQPVDDGRFSNEKGIWDNPDPEKRISLKGIVKEFYLLADNFVEASSIKKGNVKKNLSNQRSYEEDGKFSKSNSSQL